MERPKISSQKANWHFVYDSCENRAVILWQVIKNNELSKEQKCLGNAGSSTVSALWQAVAEGTVAVKGKARK